MKTTILTTLLIVAFFAIVSPVFFDPILSVYFTTTGSMVYFFRSLKIQQL